jgi:3-dehydroquinate dehydratase
MNKKDSNLQVKLSKSYNNQKDGTFEEKITEAYKNLKFDLESLYTEYENEVIDSIEYYQNKIEGYESFVEIVMKGMACVNNVRN